MLLSFIFAYAIALAIFIYIASSKTIGLSDVTRKLDGDKNETGTLVCVICGFIVGIAIIVFLSSRNLISVEMSQQDYGLLLSTSATIIGTILAVSFSILILGLQHALSKYAPSLLRYFMIERTTITCFVILSFSAIICLFGLIFPWKDFMVPLSLFLLSYSFVILGYYYYNKSKTSTTLSIFKKLKIDGQKFIKNKLEKRIRTEIEILSRNPQLLRIHESQRSMHLKIITTALLNDTNILQPIQENLEEMIGLVHNCLHNNDYQSVKYGLHTICQVIRYYMDKRREHPPDKLIESLYAQIETVTVIAIEKNNPYVLRNIVKTYEQIGVFGTRNAN